MQNKHELEFVNNGEAFELPKLSVEDEIAVLDYLNENIKDKDSKEKKRYTEYSYAVYIILNRVDRNVTLEKVMREFSIEDLMAWYFKIRIRGNQLYSCPKCKEKISFWELITTKDKEDKSAGDTGNFTNSITKKEKKN